MDLYAEKEPRNYTKDCEYSLLTQSDTRRAFFNVLISALFNSMQHVWSMLFVTLHVLVKLETKQRDRHPRV
jgi:hypothetical protein